MLLSQLTGQGSLVARIVGVVGFQQQVHLIALMLSGSMQNAPPSGNLLQWVRVSFPAPPRDQRSRRKVPLACKGLKLLLCVSWYLFGQPLKTTAMRFDLPPTREPLPPLLKENDDPLDGAILDNDSGGRHSVVIKPELAKGMKPHQREGVQFLYQATFGSLEQLNEPGGGCILAHCMGLGKSLQVIAYLHAVSGFFSLLPCSYSTTQYLFADVDQREDQSERNPESPAAHAEECDQSLGGGIQQMALRQWSPGDPAAACRRRLYAEE